MTSQTFTSALLASLLFVTPALADEPYLQGQVTDEQGRPVEGASVKIWDCIGTCLGGEVRITDKDGQYTFENKTWRNFPHLAVSMPGRYHASTNQSGPKLSEPDTDEPRRADFVLGTPAAATLDLEGDPPKGWTQKVLLRAGRDVKLHRYDLDGRHVYGWDHWQFDLVPRGELYHVVVVRAPEIEPTDDRKERKKRERASREQRVEIVSAAITFADPQRYRVDLKITDDEATKATFLHVLTVQDATSEDRTADLVSAVPHFGPPVTKEAQQQAADLMKRVADAAKPWNARPPKAVDNYEYDAVDSKSQTTHVKIDKDSPQGPAWSDISRLRGFAYMPPLRWLFSQPDNIVFRKVDIGDDRATLVYELKSGRGFAAGLGVGPKWNGFFTKKFSAGTLVIDPKTATVLEHRLSKGPLAKETIETFSDYVAVGDGYAPKSLRIQSDGFDFRLSFRIHRKHLWLLETAHRGDDGDPAMKIENVAVTLVNR